MTNTRKNQRRTDFINNVEWRNIISTENLLKHMWHQKTFDNIKENFQCKASWIKEQVSSSQSACTFLFNLIYVFLNGHQTFSSAPLFVVFKWVVLEYCYKCVFFTKQEIQTCILIIAIESICWSIYVSTYRNFLGIIIGHFLH